MRPFYDGGSTSPTAPSLAYQEPRRFGNVLGGLGFWVLGLGFWVLGLGLTLGILYLGNCGATV